MKKTLLILAMLAAVQAFAQSTKHYDFSGIEEIEIAVKADVKISCEGAEGVDVQTGKSEMDLLDIYQEENRLYIRSKEWIGSENDINIQIAAPQLRFVQGNAGSMIEVKEVDKEEFSAMAITGEIKLYGKAQVLRASGEIGKVDASEFEAEEVALNVWDAGSVVLGSPEKISGKTRASAKVQYENEPQLAIKTYSESKFKQKQDKPKTSKVRNPEARFIEFTLKNNSLNRIQCYVKGPKADGSSFSYGFPMNPGQKREKDWSVGSKVYRVNKMGMRKLLIEIKAEDEGQVVQMYPKS
ncbi:MAG: DUF2807 domain-containing protein [Bacteroidota bacterium]